MAKTIAVAGQEHEKKSVATHTAGSAQRTENSIGSKGSRRSPTTTKNLDKYHPTPACWVKYCSGFLSPCIQRERHPIFAGVCCRSKDGKKNPSQKSSSGWRYTFLTRSLYHTVPPLGTQGHISFCIAGGPLGSCCHETRSSCQGACVCEWLQANALAADSVDLSRPSPGGSDWACRGTKPATCTLRAALLSGRALRDPEGASGSLGSQRTGNGDGVVPKPLGSRFRGLGGRPVPRPADAQLMCGRA